jgi:hypothetical protein
VLGSVVQVDASQGRRGRDTGSYLDRGERSEAPPGRRRYVADSWRWTLMVIAQLIRDGVRPITAWEEE